MIQKNQIKMWLFLIVTTFISWTPLAAQNNELVSDLKAFKVLLVDGEEELIEATSVKPGDIIEYQLTYTNQTGGGITNLRPVLPIPQGMMFIEETANPSIHAVSISEDQLFRKPPLFKEVTLPNGSKSQIKISAKEYRYLQWLQEEMDSNEQVMFTARLKVITPQAN